MSDRDSFVFYREWYEIVTNCDEQTQLSMYRAIMDYVFLGTIPTDPALQLVFPLIKLRLDSDCAKWVASKEQRREAVKRRWEKEKNLRFDTSVYDRMRPDTKVYESIRADTNDTVYVNVYGYKDTNVSMDTNNKDTNVSTSSCDDSVVDFAKMMSYWNEIMASKSIPQIQKMTDRRKAMVKARVKEYGKDAIQKVIINAAESLFLNGGGDRGVVFDFDWIFRPNNFPKVLEGYYNIKRMNNGEVKTNNSQEQRLSAVSDRISQLLAEDGNS